MSQKQRVPLLRRHKYKFPKYGRIFTRYPRAEGLNEANHRPLIYYGKMTTKKKKNPLKQKKKKAKKKKWPNSCPIFILNCAREG